MRTLIRLPDAPTGAIYNPERGFFSVVIPLERTNLITNPSVEAATTNYTAVGGSIARSTTYAYHGAYSLAVTPGAGTTDGVYYGTVSLTSGTTYAASCKIKGIAGRNYKISFATTGGVDLATYRFTASGRWQWVWILYNETSSTTRRIYIVKDSQAATGVYYIDGLQVESCADGVLAPTTFIDGDQVGLLPNQFPVPYRWNGAAHASTSTRLVTTRAGGYVINFDRFRFKILAYAGLGLTAVANVASTGAGLDGATYQTTVALSRQFAVNGFFDAETPYALDRFRSDLYSAIGPDSSSPRQPAVLLYQPYDGYEEAGSMGRIVASYESGLEQNASVVPQETVQMTFTQWLPNILGGDAGVALTTQSSVTDADYILRRGPDGTWAAMGTGGAGGGGSGVIAIAVGLDGTVYAAGDFASMGGVANTLNIAAWSPTTQAWTALSTGVNNIVNALAVAPNGDLYVGGTFTTAGATSADYLARWDGSAFNVVSSATALNAQVRALKFNSSGTLYVGGDFTTAGGVVGADRLATWNGTTYAIVGGASAVANGGVYGIELSKDESIVYIAGTFTNVNGVADADYIAQWDGSLWSELGTTAANAAGAAFAYDANGFLYAGGAFTAVNGITANYIARWNGSGWTTLGSGMNNTVFGLSRIAEGIAASGDFTTAGGLTLPDTFALWNGSTWVAFDVDLPGSARAIPVKQTSDGTLYVGFTTTGTATAAGVTTVTNVGTARAYPTITIKGPSSGTAPVYRITNTTNGKLLHLNLTINAGETVTITTSGRGASISSDFRGDISSVILPGSASDFALEPGANKIAFFTTSSTVTALIQYTNGYQSAADLVD